jgi:transcriptional regulator with XRE-family HTH domain
MSTKKTEAKAMVNNFQELLDRIKAMETYDSEVARGEVSDQIDVLMKRENVTKAELARRLNKSRAYVTKILQGNANFTLDTLVNIAKALGYKFAPAFLPLEAEWTAAGAIHLSAKTARTEPGLMVEEDKDYIHVEIDAEGADNEEGTKRTAS